MTSWLPWSRPCALLTSWCRRTSPRNGPGGSGGRADGCCSTGPSTSTGRAPWVAAATRCWQPAGGLPTSCSRTWRWLGRSRQQAAPSCTAPTSSSGGGRRRGATSSSSACARRTRMPPARSVGRSGSQRCRPCWWWSVEPGPSSRSPRRSSPSQRPAVVVPVVGRPFRPGRLSPHHCGCWNGASVPGWPWACDCAEGCGTTGAACRWRLIPHDRCGGRSQARSRVGSWEVMALKSTCQ